MLRLLEENFTHKHRGLCQSLEHQTRDCEERGAKKRAMLAKKNVPGNSQVGLMAATVGAAAHGDGKAEWKTDSCASFYMSHTRAGMNAYKKASAGTIVEAGDGTILPVDWLETIEVDLDRSGTAAKPVKVVAVGYVPELSRNLLFTHKAEEQWRETLVWSNPTIGGGGGGWA